MVLFINEFQDYEADKKVGKKTLVTKLGKRNALKFYHSILALTYLWIMFGVLFGMLPIYTLLMLLTFPLLFRIVKISKENYNKIYELLPANAGTIMLHLFIGLILSAAHVIDKIVI